MIIQKQDRILDRGTSASMEVCGHSGVVKVDK